MCGEGGELLAILTLYEGINFLQKGSRYKAALLWTWPWITVFYQTMYFFHNRFISEIF